MPWSLLAILQCPHASAQASSTPWDQTCFGFISSSPSRLLPGAPPALLRTPGPTHGPPLSPPTHRSPRRAPKRHQQGSGLSMEVTVCWLPHPYFFSDFGKAFRGCSPRHQLSHQLPHHGY